MELLPRIQDAIHKFWVLYKHENRGLRNTSSGGSKKLVEVLSKSQFLHLNCKVR